MAEKLGAKRFGLAGGILYGATISGTTLLSLATGFGKEMLTLWSTWHPGYSISYAGSAIGLVWGFLCGFVGAYIFAWLYNSLEGKV